MSEVTRIGVLGAGTMGAGIAQVAAEAGLDVALLDPVAGAYDRARDRIGGFLERKVAKGQLHAGLADAALARITESGSVADLAATGFVIEAIPEDLDLKRDAFRRLSAADANAVLATNTSSLSVGEIAVAASRPERVVGMHFFNPVPLMALVEVIAAPRTNPEVVSATVALAERLGKTAVEAADTPGFIVNRVARPFYLEALRILGEGAADVPAIDAALRARRLPDGAVRAHRHHRAGRQPRGQRVGVGGVRPLPEVPATCPPAGARPGRAAGPQDERRLLRLRDRWRAWRTVVRPRGERLPVGPHPLPEEAITDRVLAAIVNEAASAVEDGTARPEAIDTAMRLGTNWPRARWPGARSVAWRARWRPWTPWRRELPTPGTRWCRSCAPWREWWLVLPRPGMRPAGR